MSEMTDFGMSDFVRSGEESGAEMNRVEEKEVGLRKNVEEERGDKELVRESGSVETGLSMSEEEERGDKELVRESGSVETGLSMSEEEEGGDKELVRESGSVETGLSMSEEEEGGDKELVRESGSVETCLSMSEEEEGGDKELVRESGSVETCLSMSEEEERGDKELVRESGSVETGLSMSEDEKYSDDSVSDRDYQPEDSESGDSESSDSQLRKIVKIKRRKMLRVSDGVSPPGVGFIENRKKVMYQQALEAQKITEHDPYDFVCESGVEIPPVPGISEAERLAIQTGARAFVKNCANEAINPAGSLKKVVLGGQGVLRESKDSDKEREKPSESGEPSESGPKRRRPRQKKKCPVCGLMNSNITRHMRDIHLQTYVGEGEFQCQIVNCRSRFSSRLGLVRHLRGNRHAGEPEAKAMARSFDRRRKTLPIQESPSSFNWEDIMKQFFEFLMGHDGGAHDESVARDRVHLLRNIIKDCEFENLQSFNIEDYKKKHVQKLQKEKKKPATFISHSNAVTNFLNFAILKKLTLSFNVGEALLNLKNRRASYRKSLKKRRQVIRERDRRNALDPEEVARVMKNPIFHKTSLATKLWEKDPGAEIRRAHGEILMAFLIIQNSQRTSAVRNMLVDELNHGFKTKKQRWIVRVRDHKTSATYGDATIVMPGWLKDGLDNLVQFNGGACDIVFPHQGKALTSSAAAKVLQRVWKLAGGRGKFTATSNRKHSATQVIDLYWN
ncbi:unnamed protein product [Clavelina lepadiformis]|uniref:C2H2-type domain-containing protein n=1 Tax=Clavelina lepadiformis TaxID=159417 RepID=A0ABP0G891_CLALP